MEQEIDTRSARSLILFSFAMFAQATIALSIVGVLGSISAEWSISATEGALLITAFGGTFALCAPIMQMIVGHWVRRTQILTGISIMALGAAGFALAPGYSGLLFARILMGLGAALLSPVLLALGTSMVKPHQQGSALAIIAMGISIASVVGVPASAWLGGYVGPRWLYGIIAILLAVIGVLIALFITDRSRGERVGALQALKLLAAPATLSGLLVIFFITAGIFATYTMITPIMHDAYGAGTRTISVGLLLYGVSGILGNFFVRKAASKWRAEVLLKVAMLTLIAVFTALLVLPASLAMLIAALIVWPFAADIIWPSQQRRMVELEPGFRGIALALSASFLAAGMAFGSAAGGAVFASRGFAAVLTLSILLIAMGLWALGLSVRSWARGAMPRSVPTTGIRIPVLAHYYEPISSQHFQSSHD